MVYIGVCSLLGSLTVCIYGSNIREKYMDQT
uniref:Uncharacterized protein n=1 Tax=Arundo donax TaxID=35708 RepID=A0A0A9FM33_ARUDO